MGADQTPKGPGPEDTGPVGKDDEFGVSAGSFDPDSIDWSAVPLDDPRWDLIEDLDDEEAEAPGPGDAAELDLRNDSPSASDWDSDAPSGAPPDPSQRAWRHPSEVAAANAHMERFLAEDARASHPAGRSRSPVEPAGSSGRILLLVAAGAIAIAGVSIVGAGSDVVQTETAAAIGTTIAVAAPLEEEVTAEATSAAVTTTTVATESTNLFALVAETVVEPPAWAYEVRSVGDERTSETLASAIRLDGLDPRFLLTSASAIGSRTEVTLGRHDPARTRPALIAGTVVGADAASDIAVIRVDPGFAGIDSASVGSQSVYELGSAIEVRPGVPVKPHEGTILSIDGQQMTTSAPVPAGHLGAGVVNSNGSVVGMVITGSSRLANAIPADEARRIASNIADYGVANPNWLGITILATDGAIEVVSVVPGSPAAEAGLREGDQLIGAAGRILLTADQLVDIVASQTHGAEIEFLISRDGATLTVPLTVGHRPLATEQAEYIET